MNKNILKVSDLSFYYLNPDYKESGERWNKIFSNVDFEIDSTVDDQEFLKRLENKTVLGRVGVVNDLIGPLLFLASEASGYITGQGLSVDGGWTVR